MIIAYIIKVQIVFTILFLVYYTFLRKEKFLVLNRFILIGIIATAFILPTLRTFDGNSFNINQLKPQVKANSVFPQFVTVPQSPQHLTAIVKPVQQMDSTMLVTIAYFIVTVILLLIFLANLYKVYLIINTSHQHKANGLTYCESAYGSAPFSFFNFIIISKNAFHTEEYAQIITHESAHSHQLHSIDVLLADIACSILWINPLIYLYRKQLKLNLEFLADEAVLNTGIDARDYQFSLLKHSGILTTYRSANSFFTSKIKERIIKMNTAKPSISKSYKYVMLVPAILVLSILVGFQKDRQKFTLQNSLLINKAGAAINKPTLPIKPFVVKKNKEDETILIGKPSELKPELSAVYIDARTDTVKFSLVPDSVYRRFNGIYVVDDKILSDEQIRTAIKLKGRLEMILAKRPIIGMYNANDSNAVKKWGQQAQFGVVYVKAYPEKPSK